MSSVTACASRRVRVPRNLRHEAAGVAVAALVYVVLLVAFAGKEPFPAVGFASSGAEAPAPPGGRPRGQRRGVRHDAGQALSWTHTVAQWPLLALTLLWLARRDPADYARLAFALLLTTAGGLTAFAAAHSWPDREGSLVRDYLALPGVGTSSYALIAMAVVVSVPRAGVRAVVLLIALTTIAAAMLATDRHPRSTGWTTACTRASSGPLCPRTT